MLNKQKGNMYGFVTHTWNTISGRCEHNCKYCYNLGRPYFEGELRLMEKNFKDNFGEGNFIFVGSSNDLFSNNVPNEWIERTLRKCREYNNKYLFQTKNPKRFEEFKGLFPDNSIFGITLETNINFSLTKSPSPRKRFEDMCIFNTYDFVKETMITIEPIMDFDIGRFVFMLNELKPTWINIGADSKGHNLPEPSKEKIDSLIIELKKFTEVKLKDNLKRIK